MKLTKARKTVLAWISYDFADTIFSMNVITHYFMTWMAITLGKPDIWVSIPYSLSMILVALTLPFLGTIADSRGTHGRFLVVMTVTCIAGTLLIGGTAQTLPMWALTPLLGAVFLVLANYAYQGALVFYNALLPVVAPQNRWGEISGYGTGFGYVGAAIGLMLIMPFNDGKIFGFEVGFIQGGGAEATFIPTAVLFFLCALPALIYLGPLGVRKPSHSNGSPALRTLWREIRTGLTNSKKYPGVPRFLICRFFFSEAIETVILFMSIYVQKVVGFSTDETSAFFIAIIPAAVVGSFICGYVVDRFGPRFTLMWVLGGWLVSLLVILLAQSKVVFIIGGALIGIFLGSVWTTSRPLLATLIPRDQVGKFFGLYALTGRSAAMIGPLVWGIVVYVSSPLGEILKYKAAVGILALFILFSMFILRGVPDRSTGKRNPDTFPPEPE